MRETGLGYIGRETVKATIVSRLQYARDWLRAKPSDQQAKKELRIGVVNILGQSPSKYGRDRLHARSLEQLVELAISDADCAPYEYQCPWQLEQFTEGEKISTARKKGQKKCEQCGKRFRPSRSNQKYCGAVCRDRAGYKMQKLRTKAAA